MVDPLSLAISTLSLAVAATTAWLTLFRRGTVRMTQPTVIYFGPDQPRSREDIPLPKIYLRTLLLPLQKGGRVIESMHVALSRNEMHQNFNIWVYGEQDKLVRGSGLFVGETGVSANHHFLTPQDGKTFSFIQSHYKLDVFARLLGDLKPIRLFSQELDISRDISTALRERNAGLYFDWGPNSSRYLSHVEQRPPSRDAASFLRFSEEAAAPDND